MQIEAGDLILLNKADLVSPMALAEAKTQIAHINEGTLILSTQQCRVDPELIFGIGRESMVAPPRHVHQLGFDSFSYTTEQLLDQHCFERMIKDVGQLVYRAKGFVQFRETSCLFNLVAGRFTLESFAARKTELVFIGKELERCKNVILTALQQCEKGI
jgi:G3E family GTPase